MRLINSDVFQAREPLQKLMGERLPVKTAYGLAKLSSKLSEQFKIVEEVRNGLIKKYGEVNERRQVSVLPENPNWEKFVEEFNELMSQEVEIVVEKVKLPETLEIEPSVMLALEKFVYV